MKTNQVFLLFCFMFPFCLVAQNNSLFNDANIEWVGESIFEYFLEDEHQLSFEQLVERPDLNSCRTYVDGLKMNPEVTCGKPLSSFFTFSILEAVLDGKLSALTVKGHREMAIKDVKKMLVSTDTIITFFPETFEEKIAVVEGRSFHDIKSFKIVQHWYLRKGSDQLAANIVGLIPLLHTGDVKSKKVFKEGLFYIPIDGASLGNYNFDDSNFPWIKRSLGYLPIDGFKTLKGDANALLNILWEQPKNGQTKVYEFSSDPACLKPVEDDFLKNNLSESIDTVITFNPETFEEKISIVKNKAVTPDQIKGYRAVQYWYFNPKTNSLQSYLKSMGPFLKVDLKEENYYYKPLYYLEFEQAY